MVIFGWGHVRDNDLGPCAPYNCPNCNNFTFYHLYKWKKYFTLFFIPVFPYESHRQLICPVCSRGFKLDKEDFRQLKEVRADTELYLDNEISGKELANRMKAYEDALKYKQGSLEGLKEILEKNNFTFKEEADFKN